MNTREFGRSGRQVSEMGLGTWQLGSSEWGNIDGTAAQNVLAAAADAGVTFVDTADIYGLGTSEERIARFLAGRADRDQFFLASKLGRWPDPEWPENLSLKTMRRFTEDSLRRLGVEALDLTQTHCLPRDQMRQGDLFDWLRTIEQEGKIKAFGASVETMDEATECLEHEGLASLQIIFNIFRQKPIHTLFEQAKEKGVALIVRLPVASGLLSGKFTAESTFDEKDHRHFNRDGQSFNVGETFAGLPLAKGVELADAIKPLVPEGMTMAQLALRWVLDFDAVTTVIPGATRPEQATDNAAASDLPPLGKELHGRLTKMYENDIVEHIRGAY